MELYQFGIDVVVIRPGAIRTEWSGIAQEQLRQTSGSTAYGKLAERHIRMLRDADSRASDPKVVAQTILKATQARKPRTRYATGSGAKVILLLRRVLSDRWFDKLMLRIIG
jgi:NAD(P)-dependent dehydrogenase (short-subunit alcohol dehydrogenase family)